MDIRKFKYRLRRLGLSESYDQQKGRQANGCEDSRHLSNLLWEFTGVG